MTAPKTDLPPKLSMKEMVCYGIGDITANLYLQFIGLFLIVFYTDILGIPAAIAGLIAMASRVFDGVNDIFVGYLSDKTGNYKKWILWGSVATAISFVFMFTKFNLSTDIQIIFALVAFCVWTMMYTCYAIPFNAFAATMTQNTDERTKLNSIRFAIVAIPSLIISIATPFLRSSQTENNMFTKTALVFAVIATIATLICIRGVVERVKIPKKSERTTAKDYFKAVLDNKQLLILSIAFFLRTLASGIYNASMAYYFNYHFGSIAMMSFILFIAAPLSAISALSVPILTKYIGKKKLVITLGVLFAVSNIIRFIIPSNTVVVLITSIVCVFTMSANLAPFFTMVADTTDYGLWRTGKNVRAINYGFYTFCQKLGMAFSASIVGALLAFFGYVANQPQTPAALNGILITFCLIPAGICLVMSFVLCAWKLTETKMHSIVSELQEKASEEN